MCLKEQGSCGLCTVSGEKVERDEIGKINRGWVTQGEASHDRILFHMWGGGSGAYSIHSSRVVVATVVEMD